MELNNLVSLVEKRKRIGRGGSRGGTSGKGGKGQNARSGGGVAANSLLRSKFNQLGIKTKIQSHIPDFQYCTDNAAMIAVTGYYKFLQKDFLDLKATIF